MKNLIVCLILGLACLAQGQQAVRFETPTVKTSGCPTNSFLVTTNRECRLLGIQAYSATNVDVYLLVCLTNDTPADGFPAIEMPEMPVFAGLGANYTWPAGRPIPVNPGTNNFYLVVSQCPLAVTNSSPDVRLEVTYYGKPN